MLDIHGGQYLEVVVKAKKETKVKERAVVAKDGLDKLAAKELKKYLAVSFVLFICTL